MIDYRDDAEIIRCAALGPALSLVYAGRVDEGRTLFRELCTRADGRSIEQRAFDSAIDSSLWVGR